MPDNCVHYIIFETMAESKHNPVTTIVVERITLFSEYLEREVTVDLYLPASMPHPEQLSLLLVNDGQDLLKMPFDEILDELLLNYEICPLICAGIHCGPDRKMEYGTAYSADFKGRGAKAGLYTKFLFDELLPYI
ncbi:MAG: esterase family protein, partial [Sediminibacterium sp.]|nr:esterase family protein [Sediminibacterium sp.]